MDKNKQETSTHLSIYEKMRAVPESAKTPIKEGRLAGRTNINTMWRIKKLTDTFGPCGIGWNYRVSATRTEELPGGQKALFVDIMLKYKVPGTDTWSEEIHGTGGNVLVRNEKNGLYLNDDAYKMAISDAISNAGKLLGLGADVYFENDVDNKYLANMAGASAQKQDVKPAETPAPRPQPAQMEGLGKPEMNKLHPKWNYSIAVIASSSASDKQLRNQLEKHYTITDSNFQELLRLAGRTS